MCYLIFTFVLFTVSHYSNSTIWKCCIFIQHLQLHSGQWRVFSYLTSLRPQVPDNNFKRLLYAHNCYLLINFIFKHAYLCSWLWIDTFYIHTVCIYLTYAKSISAAPYTLLWSALRHHKMSNVKANRANRYCSCYLKKKRNLRIQWEERPEGFP